MKSLIKLSHRSGFSLVELIISIGVILTALLGLAGLLGLSIRGNETIRQTTLCKTLATTITETIIVARESEIIDFTNLETVFSGANVRRPILAPGPDNIYGTNDDIGDLTFSVGPNPALAAGQQKFDRTTESIFNLTQQGYGYRILVIPIAGSNNALKQISVEIYPPGSTQPNDRGVYRINLVLGSYPTSLTG
ncbi:MAG: hypothetical protein WAQ98_12550 [Blastocatellia bacterium]